MTRTLAILAMIGLSVPCLQGQARQCLGSAGVPSWGVKLTPHGVGILIDAHLTDTCTVFYQIQFEVELFDPSGQSIGIRLFAAPGVEIQGPTIVPLEYSLPERDRVAKVIGKSLNCKKRILGGLPLGRPEFSNDPTIYLERNLEKSVEAKRSQYDIWITGYRVDYLETQIIGTGQLSCSSGDMSETVSPRDFEKCQVISDRADKKREERRKQYGEPISPDIPPR